MSKRILTGLFLAATQCVIQFNLARKRGVSIRRGMNGRTVLLLCWILGSTPGHSASILFQMQGYVAPNSYTVSAVLTSELGNAGALTLQNYCTYDYFNCSS